ncbi:MAG: hypothetical protein FJZ43_00310 [Candidatus Staskawiczbacteria bacterium]|nr:hypothetical protein [Candidatus Staskawiczbacteria bacterium]
MNKKFLLISIVGIVLAVIGALLAYSYIFQNNETNLDFIESKNTQNQTNNSNDSNVGIDGIELKTSNEVKEGLIICSDKCGDGICQDKNSMCEDGSLNCICIESALDCPSDCR